VNIQDRIRDLWLNTEDLNQLGRLLAISLYSWPLFSVRIDKTAKWTVWNRIPEDRDNFIALLRDSVFVTGTTKGLRMFASIPDTCDMGQLYYKIVTHPEFYDGMPICNSNLTTKEIKEVLQLDNIPECLTKGRE